MKGALRTGQANALPFNQMPIAPPPAAAYPLESSQGAETIDPRALLGAAAGPADQPAQQDQTAGLMDGLKSMMAVITSYADTPGLSEGARMARQGIVQMMLALNQQQEPSGGQMAM